MKNLIIITFLFSFFHINGQKPPESLAKDTLSLIQLFNIPSDEDTIIHFNGRSSIISSKIFEFMFDKGIYSFLDTLNYHKDSANRIVIPHWINGRSLKFTDDNMGIIFKDLVFKMPLVLRMDTYQDFIPLIAFENCVFQNKLIVYGKTDIVINDSYFSSDIEITGNNLKLNNNIWLSDTIPVESPKSFAKRYNDRKGNSGGFTYFIGFENDHVKNIKRNATVFGRKNLSLKNSAYLKVLEGDFTFENNTQFEEINTIISGEINEFTFKSNLITGILDISGGIISTRFTVTDSQLNGFLDISNTVLPEVFNKIKWASNSDFRLVVKIPYKYTITKNLVDSLGLYPFQYEEIDSMNVSIERTTYYAGLTREEVSLDYIFDLKRSYFNLYKIYKENVDLESANWAYSKMMDLEGNRLKYKFSEKSDFKNFFRWKLSQLLKYYVDYGTDPAKAIVISVYLIFGFAIFYLFFPSEWDKKSKSKLIQDFGLFIKRNEHGYIKPFFIMLWGIFVSLINAITLSLNAFVTLGFGTIPTKGLARYVCVIQGFIGWFLLSIFTVALINQVLA